MCILQPTWICCGGDFLKVPCLIWSSWCVSAIHDLVGQWSGTELTVKTIVCTWQFLTSRSPANLRWKSSIYVGRQCEPWRHHQLERGSMERSASSCSWLCNGESIRRPWCSQLDVYNSAHLDMVMVALSPVGPASSALLGVLEPAATLWVSVS